MTIDKTQTIPNYTKVTKKKMTKTSKLSSDGRLYIFLFVLSKWEMDQFYKCNIHY